MFLKNYGKQKGFVPLRSWPEKPGNRYAYEWIGQTGRYQCVLDYIQGYNPIYPITIELALNLNGHHELYLGVETGEGGGEGWGGVGGKGRKLYLNNNKNQKYF